jgi:hypothetical protein
MVILVTGIQQAALALALMEACAFSDKTLVVTSETNNHHMDEQFTCEALLSMSAVIECTPICAVTERYASEDFIDFEAIKPITYNNVLAQGRIVLTHVDPNRSRGTPN